MHDDIHILEHSVENQVRTLRSILSRKPFRIGEEHHETAKSTVRSKLRRKTAADVTSMNV